MLAVQAWVDYNSKSIHLLQVFESIEGKNRLHRVTLGALGIWPRAPDWINQSLKSKWMQFRRVKKTHVCSCDWWSLVSPLCRSINSIVICWLFSWKRHWDSSAITPRHDCWALSPHHKYKYDHTYRTCVSVKYLILTFPLRFRSMATFQVALRCSQKLTFRLIRHIKLLVLSDKPCFYRGTEFKATWNEPSTLTGQFQLSCCISS